MTQPGGKYAVFMVTEPNGTPHSVGIRFDWGAGRFYFPFVYQTSPGVWGAWIFDYTANTWLPIGQLTLPVAWGKLAPSTTTTAHWYGQVGARCSEYPRADVYFSTPVAFVGAGATVANPGATDLRTGDCPAENNLVSGSWAHHRLGADA